MKITLASLLTLIAFSLITGKSQAADDQGSFQCIAVKLTIANKEVDSVVEWNTKTGEARLLNAASFTDKTSGQQGNVIGWVPLVNLQQAVQNLASQIQAQQSAAKTTPSPAAPKKN